MQLECDIAIIGSGFAGSLMAVIARRMGHSVVLLEPGSHPRFSIGESTTPLSNLILEELAADYELEWLKPFSQWGSWQRHHPGIGCGLKRGFTFYQHRAGAPFQRRNDHSNEWLVAASPSDAVADTHWYRSEFDEHLKNRAESEGVRYLERCRVTRGHTDANEAVLQAERPGGEIIVRARFVLDASGPRGALHRCLGLAETPLPNFPNTQTVFTHFRGVKVFSMNEGICDEPPYPPESAAVHHLFESGWFWVLHFGNGITSAGVSFRDSGEAPWRIYSPESAWSQLLGILPSLETTFTSARAVEPFIHLKHTSFCSSHIAGNRWALLPSAAGFVDPLLSTGIPLTLLGVQRMADALKHLDRPDDFSELLSDYAEKTRQEFAATERLIAALHWNLDHFPVFTALTKLYFAAMSFSETKRRLGQRGEAGTYLLHDQPEFGPAMKRCLDRAIQGGRTGWEPGAADSLLKDIQAAIEPIDIAGLTDDGKGSWRSVEARDLIENRHKLNASQEEIERLLVQCGMQLPGSIKLPIQPGTLSDPPVRRV